MVVTARTRVTPYLRCRAPATSMASLCLSPPHGYLQARRPGRDHFTEDELEPPDLVRPGSRLEGVLHVVAQHHRHNTRSFSGLRSCGQPIVRTSTCRQEASTPPSEIPLRPFRPALESPSLATHRPLRSPNRCPQRGNAAARRARTPRRRRSTGHPEARDAALPLRNPSSARFTP